MVKVVEIVTISELMPVFKEGAEANAIQVAKFNFDNGGECGFNVIAQKGLYEVGSNAIYIQPDYCLSENELFNSFIAPGGDPKKSRLGKQNRIRAIKFNFSFEGSTDPIYSNGILMPLSEVEKFLGVEITEETDLAEELGVTKYEEPETAGSGLIAGEFPSFMYKTDETNIMNIVDHVKRVISEGQELGIAIKRDGSSHTTYFKVIDGDYKSGVCSRSQEKKMDQTFVTDYVDADGNTYHRYFDQETKTKGWFSDTTSLFKTDDEVAGFTTITKEVKDSWIELATNSGLLENGLEYCKTHGLQLAFRGEIIGQGLKGSGNKVNPDANEKQKLVLFGIDDLSEGFARRINYSSPHNLRDVSKILGIEYTPVYTAKFSTYEDLCEYCDGIFKKEKEEGRIIEGVVVRTMYTNDLSCKYMNPEYDAKK
jgi:RNA ligase (TIGR02306 family)